MIRLIHLTSLTDLISYRDTLINLKFLETGANFSKISERH